MRPSAPVWPAGGATPAAPGLLVPIQVDALPITSPGYLGDWSWTPPSYGQLRTLLPVDAAAFTERTPFLPGAATFVGTVVSWALPDALTQGAEQDGQVSYPDAPNRWLVVRRAPTNTRAAWSYRAWIVASDYLDGPLGSPWPNATATGSARLGMSWSIETWPGEAEVSKHALTPPLTAVGAGDATFAAFVPNVVNVFALADPLTDVPAGPLDYTVLGWYAGPAIDPLLGTGLHGPDGWQTTAQWQDLVDRLRWSVGDSADLADSVLAAANWAAAHGQTAHPDRPRTCYPARTLCHGSTQQVLWLGPNAPFRSGVPTSNPNLPTYRAPRVALAHSTSDALTMLVARAESDRGLDHGRVEELSEILQAFQLGDLPMLDTADGATRLAIGEQAGWFEHTGGGTRWEALDPRDSDSPAGQRSTTLSASQAALLAEANLAQQRLDDTAATLGSLQWQRFALWWKHKRLANMIPPPEQREVWMAAIKEAVAALDPAIEREVLAFRWWHRHRDEAIVRLVPILAPLTLVAGTKPPFQRPNNPVVLVSGAGRTYRHGADGRFEDEGVLRCRFTGQTVSGLAVPVGGQTFQVSGANLGPAPPPGADLPPETHDLLTEAVILAVDSAPQIAVNAAEQARTDDPWTLLSSIRTAQTAVWTSALVGTGPPATCGELVFQYGLGAVPSKVAVQFWKPPWTPLFVDWMFDFAPGSPEQSLALQHWQFPGAGAEPAAQANYSWTGGPVSMADVLGIQGRTLLTPQAGEVLASRLDKYVEDYAADPTALADLWALTDAAGYLRRADLLAQATTGFNLDLLQRDPSAFPLPSDHSLDPLLDPAGAPALHPDSFPVPGSPSDDPSPFNAIRAGHARLTKLWVVDVFGQVFKIIDPHGGALPPATTPELAPDLLTASDLSLIEFKPRLSQFTRLQLNLLSAVDDTAAVDLVTGADPVCGWVISNHLDRSLLFFSAAGTPLGELMVSGDAAVWVPTPTRTPPPRGTVPVDIDNPHLQAMVNGVIGAGPRSDAALEALVDLVDTALWTIDPSGGWADEELPVLIGRPLAVVRAELVLDVQGRPAYSQAWQDTGSSVTDGFDRVPFPVRLGSAELLDDGLVGYYLNDDYRQIQTVHGPGPAASYVGDRMPTLPVGGAALLTLLMDPRGKVHAASGILPVAECGLPDEFSTPALSAMRLLFRCGPVLNDPAVPSLPLPALERGTWSWVQYLDTAQPARGSAIAPADPTPSLPDSPAVIREGWLELLLGQPPTTLTYAVRPAAVGVTINPASPTVTELEITAYNGTDDVVVCEQIGFEVPVGDSAADLTADPSTILASVAKDAPWQIRGDQRGSFVATPVGDSTVPPGQTLTFTLSGLRVSTVPGMAAIDVHEQAGAIRVTSIDVGKVTVRPTAELTYTIAPGQVCVAPGEPLSFTLTGYNGGPHAVMLTRLVFVVPLGTGATGLSPTAEGMQLAQDGGSGPAWTVEHDGHGTFVCLPNSSPARLEPGQSVVFGLSGVVRPAATGRSLVTVVEAGTSQVIVSTAVTKVVPAQPRPTAHESATTRSEVLP